MTRPLVFEDGPNVLIIEPDFNGRWRFQINTDGRPGPTVSLASFNVARVVAAIGETT